MGRERGSKRRKIRKKEDDTKDGKAIRKTNQGIEGGNQAQEKDKIKEGIRREIRKTAAQPG